MKALMVAALAAMTAFAQPEFKGDKLVRPANYREWIFLSSGLGMTYTAEPSRSEPSFDNVFVSREAYKSFLQTGVWPEKTMFVLEVRASATNGSINKAGHYQSDDFRLSAEVKDSSRFKDKWEYFAFPATGEPADPLPRTAGCYACHSQHGAVENTFVQFYPTLLTVAKSKGTLKTSEPVH
jgi:Cytochrome P460